jgi:predicted permease
MKFEEKNVPEKSKRSSSSIVLYVAGSVVALIAVALLINNIMLFKDNVNQYVAQGYPAADVIKQLIPSQLLPGIFEPIAVYGGIAFVLFYAGLINQKVSKCLMLLTEVEVCNDATEESVMEENITDVGNVEATKREETIEEDNKATDDSK